MVFTTVGERGRPRRDAGGTGSPRGRRSTWPEALAWLQARARRSAPSSARAGPTSTAAPVRGPGGRAVPDDRPQARRRRRALDPLGPLEDAADLELAWLLEAESELFARYRWAVRSEARLEAEEQRAGGDAGQRGRDRDRRDGGGARTPPRACAARRSGQGGRDEGEIAARDSLPRRPARFAVADPVRLGLAWERVRSKSAPATWGRGRSRPRPRGGSSRGPRRRSLP